MKFRKPALYIQILLGLVLGALFGLLFGVDQNLLILEVEEDGQMQEVVLRDWETVLLRSAEGEWRFGAKDQVEIMHLFRRLLKSTDAPVTVIASGVKGEQRFENVRSMRKEQTIATVIKPLGDIFIRLLMMIAIPLVFASLLVGVSSLHDITKMARIGGKTIGYYILTTALAITIGVTLGNVVQPGKQMDTEARDRLLAAYEEDAVAKIEQNISVDFIDYLVNLVPKNAIRALADAEMLQIIFFALLLGISLLFIDRTKADRVIGFFDAISDAMIRMVDLVMLIAPYAVFALIAATISEFGFGILQTLIWYIIAVVAGLTVQTFLVYPLLLKTFARDVPLWTFLRELRPAQLVAFTTSSSAATLPVTMESCENIGAPKSVTSFVLPLGATINMDGTALYQGVAAVFIAQVYGMDLSLTQQLTVVLTATLASIGTAPVPGVGIIMLIIVLRSVGVPETGIALILGVDRILDMCRTITNVTSDATATMIVASTEKVFRSTAAQSD
ncbi:MAG: dicarboxylate/amino acid:cation symporter [Bacteroidetes bacterium]|nr:dicarboxylate/amino acid:cation symporter [Bacteroidota bacterium]